MIVIESRRRIGYDFGEEFAVPDGAHTTFPVLADGGVLVYTVNGALNNGLRPLRVISNPANTYGDSHPLHFTDTPFLRGGQSVAVGGYTITVDSTTRYTDTVTIIKAGGP